MSGPDPRLTPFSGRVAAKGLEGIVAAERYADPEPVQARGNPFLCDAPGGVRVRQALTGDPLGLFDRRDGWSYVRALKDGYCGWVPDAAIVAPDDATHGVSVRTSWLQPAPTSRRPALADLHLGSRVRVLSEADRWARVRCGGDEGYLPASHLRPLDSPERDPIEVARRFLGTPYVWAGNTGFGIDCSGLVQACLLACGIPCPGDSDLQEGALGRALGPEEEWRAGDLVFWKGHVALVADPLTLIHAYGHAMLVGYEPIAQALPRILAAGDPVSSRRRL